MSTHVALVYHNSTDVLYVTLQHGVATRTITTVEGHVVRLGPGGIVLGLQVADALWRAGRDGGLAIDVPLSDVE